VSDAENTETQAKSDPGTRIDPVLDNLNIEGVELNKEQFRDAFIQLWNYEEGDQKDEEEQYLLTVGIFIYTAHNILDNYNIRIDKARRFLVDALKVLKQKDRSAMIEKERASDNPFKSFVENHSAEIDETYTWQHFMLDHKTTNDEEWTYKMKKCWFSSFFIQLGRTNLTETACLFDKIPWEERQDYVDLKLNNMFSKLGKFCQFNYKPTKAE
jgi:hypothetical protein